MSSWDDFYLGMAEYVSGKSKDPSTKVGCVITRPDNTVASLGYNGFPRGVPDEFTTREDKIEKTIHAEVNAVLNAHERLDGCTAYVTHPPCSPCAAVLIQAGIKEVVTKKPSDDLLSRWGDSIDRACSLLHSAGVFCIER